MCPPPIDHVMTRLQGADIADSFQIWSATASALNEQFRQPTKIYPLILGLGKPDHKKGGIRDKKYYRGIRAWKMDMR